MNKKLKKIIAAVSAVSLMSSLALSMSAFAESEELTISKDYIDKIDSYYEANKDDSTVIDYDYIKNMTEQEYQDRYGDVCEGDLFYTCMGAEISAVDENGEPFENAEIQFIERVDGGNDKYKVIASWNTSDEPVKKILLEDMMLEYNGGRGDTRTRREYSIIVNAPEGYTCDEIEDLKEVMAMPEEKQPTYWIYCMTDVMSVQQTKTDNSIANMFGLEHYYQHHEIEIIPETLYQQRYEEKYGGSCEDRNTGSSSGDKNEIFRVPIENILPEPTLIGDANEDGKVSLADAVLIMQALSNPDEYKLTPQGMANADIAGDGDGVTAMDALRIQEIELGIE